MRPGEPAALLTSCSRQQLLMGVFVSILRLPFLSLLSLPLSLSSKYPSLLIK